MREECCSAQFAGLLGEVATVPIAPGKDSRGFGDHTEEGARTRHDGLPDTNGGSTFSALTPLQTGCSQSDFARECRQ